MNPTIVVSLPCELTEIDIQAHISLDGRSPICSRRALRRLLVAYKSGPVTLCMGWSHEHGGGANRFVHPLLQDDRLARVRVNAYRSPSREHHEIAAPRYRDKVLRWYEFGLGTVATGGEKFGMFVHPAFVVTKDE